MTIAGWILFIACAGAILGFGIILGFEYDKAAVVITTSIILIIILFAGMQWYFKNTASGQRAMVDQKSNLNNGIERTVTVYTADGEKMAQYKGKIDISSNDGGYVKFDFEGKRYIYFNCFVETIAEIE